MLNSGPPRCQIYIKILLLNIVNYYKLIYYINYIYCYIYVSHAVRIPKLPHHQHLVLNQILPPDPPDQTFILYLEDKY